MTLRLSPEDERALAALADAEGVSKHEATVRAIAERQPLRAVFRDSSFADSPARINVEEIFRLLSPDTNLRVL